MTKNQIDAIENLDRAAARFTAARKELEEAQRDHQKARDAVRSQVPSLFILGFNESED
jgi:hypothetical protein